MFLLFSAGTLFGTTAWSANPPGKVTDRSAETLYNPNQYDSLLTRWYEGSLTEAYQQFLQDFIELEWDEDLWALNVDQVPDSVYEARLRMIASAVQLPYNDIVRKYIIAYTGRLKNHMQQMLGLAQYYFPIIEEELDRQGLPCELKILPMIESALQPQAVSRAGATGIWQFMLRTGKGMGLEINSLVDERLDPVAATLAACEYLKQLHAIYQDWTLALAAYNCGPGNINKAFRRAPEAKSYWDIYEYLPKETREYVPSFIAATYAYTFHKAHGMEPILPEQPMVTDTINIHKMMHFEQVASTLEIPIETLRKLNPQYKLDIIPATEKTYSLVLPVQYITEFVSQEPDIYAKDTVYLTQYINPANFDPNRPPAALAAASPGTSGRIYKVKQNDILGSIARRHGVTVAALMRANNLTEASARRLRIGQVLTIP
ncbi:MAG: transglycosylase SLT domain-containing protein [Rikenellaceae bacterium]|nr:transglycosylase SLT domain-containing protein [Rikenellaceae bacterium]